MKSFSNLSIELKNFCDNLTIKGHCRYCNANVRLICYKILNQPEDVLGKKKSPIRRLRDLFGRCNICHNSQRILPWQITEGLKEIYEFLKDEEVELEIKKDKEHHKELKKWLEKEK